MRCEGCGNHDDLKAYRIEWQDRETGQAEVRAIFACPQCSQGLPKSARVPQYDVAKTDTMSGAAHESRAQLADLFDALGDPTTVEYMPASLAIMSFIALAVALVNNWWIESLLATSLFAISIYTDKRIRRQHTP